MKNLSILVPAVAAGVLVAAMVFAAPTAHIEQSAVGAAPDRAAAYVLAQAD